MKKQQLLLSLAIPVEWSNAWVVSSKSRRSRSPDSSLFGASTAGGYLHGQGSCFLPLKQLDQDYYAPRIIQIAGAYPGITAEEIMAVTSEPSPEPGQWSYDFSDPDGPQVGTVALEGSQLVHEAADPIVIIADHNSLKVPLPPALKDGVDLAVLVDRATQRFAERKFLVVDDPNDGGVKIAAYHTKAELPANGKILGQVLLVQIPWLPAMKPTKTGFMEADEYF